MNNEENEVRENSLINENESVGESVRISEDLSGSVKENQAIDESGESTSSKKRNLASTKKLTSLSVTSAAVVGVAVIAATNLVNFNMDATINSFEYRDGLISYDISYENMTGDNTLSFDIYEDNIIKSNYTVGASFDTFTQLDIRNYNITYNEETQTIAQIDSLKDYISSMDKKAVLAFDIYQDDALERQFKVYNNGANVNVKGTILIDTGNLSSKLESAANVTVKYKATLKGFVGLLDRTFDNYIIKIDKMTSEFRQVTGYCNCSVDGYFYFKMDFDDDYAQFTDFNVYLRDAQGNKVNCIFTDNLHDEQKIYVLTATLKGTNMTLVVEFLNQGVKEVKEISVEI